VPSLLKFAWLLACIPAGSARDWLDKLVAWVKENDGVISDQVEVTRFSGERRILARGDIGKVRFLLMGAFDRSKLYSGHTVMKDSGIL
jgi:hypothetical protein